MSLSSSISSPSGVTSVSFDIVISAVIAQDGLDTSDQTITTYPMAELDSQNRKKQLERTTNLTGQYEMDATFQNSLLPGGREALTVTRQDSRITYPMLLTNHKRVITLPDLSTELFIMTKMDVPSQIYGKIE